MSGSTDSALPQIVEKISNSGAHYIVPSLDCVHAFPQKDGRIKIVIDAHDPSHPRHGSAGSFVAVPPSWREREDLRREAYVAQQEAASKSNGSEATQEVSA